jgi:L-ascorbate metabolism protein UlaG (beta-lactamase superfamily)
MKLNILKTLTFLYAVIHLGLANAQGSIELLWYGQSAFKITTQSGKVIMIDPWILKNPVTPLELKSLEKIGKVDLVLVTHAHWDHMADGPEIAKMNDAP